MILSLRYILLFSLFLVCRSEILAFDRDTLFICRHSTINYKDSITQGNPISFEWTFQGGSISSSNLQYPPGVLYDNPGVFLTTVKVTFDDNSDTLDRIYIYVYDDLPDFSFPNDTNICTGNFPFRLNTVGGKDVEYEWSNGASTSFIYVNTGGTYWVNVTRRDEWNTCDSFHKTVTITDVTSPTIYLGNDIFMCQNQVIKLDAGAGVGYTYKWMPGNEITRTITASLPGFYQVTVTDANMCTGTDEIELIDSCPHYIFIPNAVSPNDDRLNDLFNKFWNFTPLEFRFEIYNRWGELIFETEDKNLGWDCKVNGDLVPQDIYVYYMRFRDTDKKWYEQRGTFYVVR